MLSDKQFGFRKGLGTLECLSCIVDPIYDTFNSRSFLTVVFIDIRSTYDSVHIPTLLPILHSYNLPSSFVKFIGLLLSKRELSFISPSETKSSRTTYTDLSQGSCLSPFLFNIYMQVVARALEEANIPFIMLYADDFV